MVCVIVLCVRATAHSASRATPACALPAAGSISTITCALCVASRAQPYVGPAAAPPTVWLLAITATCWQASCFVL